MHTEAINHEPAITFVQTGTQQPGRPSFGAWASYGLGSDNRDLPTFVVMITQGFGNMQALAARFWGNGFLPSEHQGCKLRSSGDPVLFLAGSRRVAAHDRRAMLDLVGALDERNAARRSTPRSTRASRSRRWRSACRCRCPSWSTSPTSPRDAGALRRRGEEARHVRQQLPAGAAAVERGVRFVQLYMRGWDQHGNLPANAPAVQGDRPGRSRRC
jgi:hypothetical protein